MAQNTQPTFEFNTSHWFARDPQTGRFSAIGPTYRELVKRVDQKFPSAPSK